MDEYIVFHQTKWDDIYDEHDNIVMPRTNRFWLEGFYGLDDCKKWVSEGHQKGSKTGAVTLENIFAVKREKLVSLSEHAVCAGATIIVCVKTAQNVHRWIEVMTKEDAEAFVKSFEDAVVVLACASYDIDFLG